MAQFAAQLREARRAAGSPTYATMARRSSVSASALSEAARGIRRPTWNITAAYLSACGLQPAAWRMRWESTEPCRTAPAQLPPAQAVASGVTVPTAADAAPVLGATGQGCPTPTPTPASPFAGELVPLAPTGTGTDTRPWRRWWVAAALAVPVLLIVATAVVTHWADPPTARSVAAVLTRPAIPCAPNGILAPAGTATAHGPAQIRMDFETGDWLWGPYWHEANLHERTTTQRAYSGRQSIEVAVSPGFTAIGTIHIDGLHPGLQVTLHYSHTAGTGIFCPFVQDSGETITWVDNPPALLRDHGDPQWRTYQWTMPATSIHGIGIQINNEGSNDLVVLLDTITW